MDCDPVCISGIFACRLISPKDEIALNPIRFLKTRVLFKLVMLFVIIIILIVESTTLVTIAISRNALSRAIIETDNQIALSVADKVSYITAQSLDPHTLSKQLQSAIEAISYARSRIVFLLTTMA